jgi:hypothetical protein
MNSPFWWPSKAWSSFETRIKGIGPDAPKALGQHFGRLHIQPVGAYIKDYIGSHSIYLDKDSLYRPGRSAAKLTTTGTTLVCLTSINPLVSRF